MIDARQLEQHDFLAGMDGLSVQRLAAITTAESVPAGRHLLKTNGTADVLRLLVTGDVTLELHDAHRGNLRLETLHDGDVFGWSAVVPPHRWMFDARAVSPCEMYAIDGPSLRELLHTEGFPGTTLYARLLGIVVERLQETRLRLIDLFGEHYA